MGNCRSVKSVIYIWGRLLYHSLFIVLQVSFDRLEGFNVNLNLWFVITPVYIPNSK